MENPYIPKRASLVSSKPLTRTEKLLKLRLEDGSPLGGMPGQFVTVCLPGTGEAAISICSFGGTEFEICVRKMGRVTSSLHGMAPGEALGIRGPYGRGFDVDELKGKDVLLIGGGIGLAPLRSLVQYCIANRRDFGRLILLHGARSPSELLFTEDLEVWKGRGDMEVLVTVDRAEDGWEGRVGVITTLIPDLDLDPGRTAAAVCGPPVMYKFVIAELHRKGIPDGMILLSLERVMRCGVGKCGHCTIGDLYCCQDGPVFPYSRIKGIWEALR